MELFSLLGTKCGIVQFALGLSVEWFSLLGTKCRIIQFAWD